MALWALFTDTVDELNRSTHGRQDCGYMRPPKPTARSTLQARLRVVLHKVIASYATNLSGRFFASIARTNLSHLAIPARFSRM
jgi:hypothetical protein